MASVFVDRLASTDKGYGTLFNLSLYPTALDNQHQLYVVANNAQTITTQSASYNSAYFIVADTTGFPDEGLILVGTEQVYYTIRTSNSFRGLKRGFAGSRQDIWPINTPVYGAVFAEPHNALKDAAINIEQNLGLIVNPAPLSLNGILTSLETRFLTPRPLFRANPRFGESPLTVTFQNFSECPAIRYLWDFGDGSVSQDFAPTHTYLANGSYTVALNVVTSLGAQGTATKKNYINVGLQYAPSFFYVSPTNGNVNTIFTFIDQSDGQIASRYWVFSDGTTYSITDPNVHTTTHTYATTGTYNPTLLLVFSDNSQKMVYTSESIVVS